MMQREIIEKFGVIAGLMAATAAATVIIWLLEAPMQIALAHLWVWWATDLSHYFLRPL